MALPDDVADPVPAWDIESFRAAVQQSLDAFVEEQAGRLQPLGEDAARLAEAAHRAVSGGKRFRAAFCYWGFHAASDDEAAEPGLLRAAAALELLHASALVHDDYMDDSDVRRGQPVPHRVFAGQHRDLGWRGDPGQYGAAAAILLGDLLLSWSDEMLRRCGLDDVAVASGLRYFDDTRSEVIAGQFLDVSAQARGSGSVATAMRVLRYKSAKYSVERPLHIGAALAAAPPPVLDALSGYGVPLGEAFQLRDDLLGVFGDPEVTGKPAGDDLREGKRTVLVALALQRSAQSQSQRLDEALGSDLSADEVASLTEVIEESGAHLEVERMITDLTARSLAALEAAPIRDRARQVLRGLARAATQRVL